ncbi:MAG: adenosylcobinamide amidohydrolase [Candidatus Binataceae bacterium]
MTRSTPWRWEIRDRTLVVRLGVPFRVLGWAPLGTGFSQARTIANHQVFENDRDATDAPRDYLRRLMRRLALDPRATVAMMTGASVRRAAHSSARRGALAAGAWCTAGCSNALRVGDRATVADTRPGTINLIVAVNEPLSEGAMAEALQIATEARVLAVQEAGIISTRSGKPATGTGTDCIVIAAPIGDNAHPYCGKHTLAGELIGRAALASCTKALKRSLR